jgi:hypothetical protein
LTISVVSVGDAGCNGSRRLEKEDASAQGVLVNSTPVKYKVQCQVKYKDLCPVEYKDLCPMEYKAP